MRDRLPAWAHRALLTRYAKFEGSELHRAVMTLMLGYKKNFGLVFPAVPVPQSLLFYLKDLALPCTYIPSRLHEPGYSANQTCHSRRVCPCKRALQDGSSRFLVPD
jgi:hypothetical protein